MFMSRLKAGSDEGMARYAAKGHQAEPAFISEYFEAMESLHENQMSALGVCKVDAIYWPGLVYNKMMYSLRDSSDGVAIITSDNYQPYAAPIEVKSRCSVNTCKQEEQNVLYLKHDNTNTDSTWSMNIVDTCTKSKRNGKETIAINNYMNKNALYIY